MTTLVLSNSKSNTFKRCQRQYKFKYVDRLKKKELALPLFRGDWLHQLLMVHYDNMDWKERHALLKAKNWDGLFAEEKEELGGNLPEEVERLMKGYLAHYRQEDKLYRVVDTEINEQVELPNGMKITIIIDMVVEEIADGSLWIWDHKTVGRFYDEDFMLIDSQLALYFWGMRVLGYDITGCLLNELITKPPTLPKFLEKSQRFEMRKNIHCDAYTYYGVLKQAGQDPKKYRDFLMFLKSRHGDWWRRTRMPRDEAMVQQILREMMDTGDNIIQATRKAVFPRTSRKECRFDCDFLEGCMLTLQGGDLKSLIGMRYEASKRPPEQEELKRLWPAHARKALTNGS